MNTLPTNWLIEVTEENQEELDRWRQQVATSCREGTLRVGYTLLSKHSYDGSYYYCNSPREVRSIEYYANYQEITIEQFRQITNTKPMNPLPTKWYIEITRENKKELEDWRQKVATSNRCNTPMVGQVLLSKHHRDNSYYYADDITALRGRDEYKGYKEITLEQFRQITNSTPTQKPMSKSIQISRKLLNVYYDAATLPQREYIINHFKVDGTTTDEAIRGLCALACEEWKPKIKANHPECFPEGSKHFDFSTRGKVKGIVSGDVADSLGMRRDFIQIRNNDENPETHYRSFYLTTDCNWELKQDGSSDGRPIMVLIPTKNKAG